MPRLPCLHRFGGTHKSKHDESMNKDKHMSTQNSTQNNKQDNTKGSKMRAAPAKSEFKGTTSRSVTFGVGSWSMSYAMASLTLSVQRPSNDDQFTRMANGSDTGTESGEESHWECCKCEETTNITIRPGNHPLGALSCECPHKTCSSCKTTGLVKPFLPMEEPCVVPVSEGNKAIRFGVLCSHCGLSWRAKQIGRFKKTLRKMPSLGVSMAQIHQKRLVHGNMPGLRKSKSTLVLGNKRIITPPGQAMEKQAEYATVKFSDVTCTCGVVIDLTSALCFQIVGPHVEANGEVEERKQVGWSTTPELQAMGHGEPIVRVRGIAHMNPLRSNPVTPEDLSMLEDIRGSRGD